MDEQHNIYLMVSDANAPSTLYDVDVSNWTEADWAVEDNVKKVARSIYMYNDGGDLLKTLYGVELPNESPNKM